jgi:hypothetical protein
MFIAVSSDFVVLLSTDGVLLDVSTKPAEDTNSWWLQFGIKALLNCRPRLGPA